MLTFGEKPAYALDPSWLFRFRASARYCGQDTSAAKDPNFCGKRGIVARDDSLRLRLSAKLWRHINGERHVGTETDPGQVAYHDAVFPRSLGFDSAQKQQPTRFPG